MKEYFGNKYIAGITQYIRQEHFGPSDFIDYHCAKEGMSRDEYMAIYGISESNTLVTEAKFPGKKGEYIFKPEEGYVEIKKTSGSTAYVKWSYTASSAFSQVWDDEVKLSGERHKGKRVWLMESVVNEKAEGDRGPIDDSAIESGLKKKAEETGVPIGLIRIIMRRGMAAWKSGHRPGATQQQWGYARVNSFLTKQEGTWGKADSDVAKEVRDGGHDSKLKKG